jgi:hypothetical protein
MKKTFFMILFVLFSYYLFCQETISNIDSIHIDSMGNIGKSLPNDLQRKSYYEYINPLISYSKNGIQYASINEEFETDGKIVTKYSIVMTFHNSIPNDIKMTYIMIFDAFFNRCGIDPTKFKKAEDGNYRYLNGIIEIDIGKFPIVIKLYEFENNISSRQIIEISLR